MKQVESTIALQHNLIAFQKIGTDAYNAWYVDASAAGAEPLPGWNGKAKPEVLAVARSFYVLRETGKPEQLYTGNALKIIEIDSDRLENFGTEFGELRGELFFSGEDEYGQELWSFWPASLNNR